jgi:hypothetical protein
VSFAQWWEAKGKMASSLLFQLFRSALHPNVGRFATLETPGLFAFDRISAACDTFYFKG